MLSSENPDSIRGIYLDGCIIDEAAMISENLINEVITPALSDRKGFMILVGTPKGMNNLFYDYFQKAQASNNWFLYRAKASDTQIVEKDEKAMFYIFFQNQIFSKRSTYFPAEETQFVSRHSLTYCHSLPPKFGSLTHHIHLF